MCHRRIRSPPDTASVSRPRAQKGCKVTNFVYTFRSHLESYALKMFSCTEHSSFFITARSPLCPRFTYANSGLNIFYARNWSYQYGTVSFSGVLDFIFISRFYQLCFHSVKKNERKKERVTRCFLCKLIGPATSFSFCISMSS